jgi:hypothetical membrane protein
VPLRAAAICGLLAPVTFVVGLVLGDLAQPDAFSPANDDVSDIGALTADSAWLYNQIAANLNGLLILGFALGLWTALALVAVPVVVAANVLFSIVGDGAATRAGSITWFIWLGLVAFRLLRIAEGRTVGPAT